VVQTDASGLKVLGRDDPDGVRKGTMWCNVVLPPIDVLLVRKDGREDLVYRRNPRPLDVVREPLAKLTEPTNVSYTRRCSATSR